MLVSHTHGSVEVFGNKFHIMCNGNYKLSLGGQCIDNSGQKSYAVSVLTSGRLIKNKYIRVGRYCAAIVTNFLYEYERLYGFSLIYGLSPVNLTAFFNLLFTVSSSTLKYLGVYEI